MNELALGQADLVVTGGVDATNNPLMYVCFSKTPALSPTGDARPFSDDADGTLLGEGLAMLGLERLDAAERDGDRIYAVIRGLGTSSDGRGGAIYAPMARGPGAGAAARVRGRRVRARHGGAGRGARHRDPRRGRRRVRVLARRSSARPDGRTAGGARWAPSNPRSATPRPRRAPPD